MLRYTDFQMKITVIFFQHYELLSLNNWCLFHVYLKPVQMNLQRNFFLQIFLKIRNTFLKLFLYNSAKRKIQLLFCVICYYFVILYLYVTIKKGIRSNEKTL